MKFVFVKDKFNKYSIRALVAAFEKFFNYDYIVVDFKEIESFQLANSLVFLSFNSLNSHNYFKMSGFLRRVGCKTVCGGPHPTARWAECLNYFDATCVGEGEYVIFEIVNDFLSNKLKTVYRSSKNVNINEFSSYPKKSYIFGPIEITRGCFFKCSYCQTPNLFNGKVRHRSLERVKEDVEYAYKNGKFDFRFITPDAAIYMHDKGVNLSAIHELFEGIKRITEGKGRIFFGSFPSEINPFHVNEDLVELMSYYCSNKRVVVGLQTASERLLRIIKRPTDLMKVEKSINLFLKYGFGVDVDFIFGLPYEKEDDVMKSIEWIKRWSEKVRIHAHYFMPLPGSDLENEKPSHLTERSVKALKSLEGNGKIFGQWIKQLELSKKLVEI